MKNLLHLCSLDLLTAFFLEADAPAHRHDLPSLIIQRGDHIVIDYHFPEDLVYEDRLITNLKFMLNRLIQKKEGWITEDARFNEFVRANYRNEYELEER